MNCLQENIVDQVAKFLKVSLADSSSFKECWALYNKLKDQRNKCHPDKVTGESEKKEAEEKFKKISSMLKTFEKYIEQIPKDNCLLVPEYREFSLLRQIEQLEQHNKDLCASNAVQKQELNTLRDRLVRSEHKQVSENFTKLRNLYRPFKNPLGISSVIVFLMFMCSRINEIASILSKFFPYSVLILNKVMFWIFVLVAGSCIFRMILGYLLESCEGYVKTTLFAVEFYKEKVSWRSAFTESAVCEFIRTFFQRKNFLYKICFSWFFNEKIISVLKDVFIDTLLTKQLITLECSSGLEHKFKVESDI